MSDSISQASESSEPLIDVEPMSVDQLAGAFVMIAGAIGSLLLVIWQSKCHCKMNLCYIFSCERRPPNEDEMKSLKDQAKELKKKQQKKGEELKNKDAKDAKDVESPEDDSPKPLSRTNSIKITEITKDNDTPNKQENSYP